MWKKIKNWLIQLNLDEEIEFYSVKLDTVTEEIKYYSVKLDVFAEEIEIEYDSILKMLKKLLVERAVLTNIIRRLKKLKEKYN